VVQNVLQRIFEGRLPMLFARGADHGPLQTLRNAGYLQVSFTAFQPGQQRLATVTDITPLGRAAIRYFGF